MEKAAAPLLTTGCIDASYIEAIKSNHRELGAYMVVAPGIMLAHARPEDGAHGLGLGFMTLETPLVFGNATNDPVQLIIALATPDANGHLQMLEVLMEFLMDTHKTEALMNASTMTEALAVIG